MFLNKLQLTIFILLLIGFHPKASEAIASMSQCMHETCQSSSNLMTVQQYLNLEKTEHPDLDSTIKRYEVDLEKVRVNREQKIRSVLTKIRDPEWISREITQMSESDLFMTLFMTVQPYNEARRIVNGAAVVTAVPTISSSNQLQYEFIQRLYRRVLAAAPLAKAAAEFRVLGTDPRNTFNLTTTQSIDSFVFSYLEARINESTAVASILREKLERSKIRFSILQRFFNPTQYAMFFAPFEVEILISSQKLKLSEEEQSLARLIISDKLSHVANAAIARAATLTEVYDQQLWQQTCREALNRALHYGLDENEVVKFERIKNEAQYRALTTIRSIFPNNLSRQVEVYLSSVRILSPLSLENYFRFMRFQIEENAKSDISENSKIDDVYKTAGELNERGDSALSSLCNKIVYSPVSDQEQDGQVTLSAYSARHTETGLTIALHEIGHAIASGMQELQSTGVDISTFSQMRSCIGINYRRENRRGARFPSDKLWTEEDWADAFASRSLRDKQTIGFCSFLGTNPDRDFRTLSERDQDTHSPSFYRILNQWVHQRGQLSPVCRSALQQEQNGIEFRDCLSTP